VKKQKNAFIVQIVFFGVGEVDFSRFMLVSILATILKILSTNAHFLTKENRKQKYSRFIVLAQSICMIKFNKLQYNSLKDVYSFEN